MKKNNHEMAAEYDLSGKKGVRGKYAEAYRSGHSVRIYKGKKIVSDQYFAAIESDVHQYFPNSKAINSTLRKLIKLIPENEKSLS